MYPVYLLTGSNLGDRAAQLSKAIQELEAHVGTIISQSSLFETEAWGVENLPPHLNQAILINTTLQPLELLHTIQNIEQNLGRIRQEKWGVRVIDIDIIYFENQIIDLPRLIIPHPLMQERNFVLVPLCEIAPNFQHPVFLKTNLELLKASKDKLKVKIAFSKELKQ